MLIGPGERSATRTIRNTADEALYFSSQVRGLVDVEVRPLAVRLSPGERASFTVTAGTAPGSRTRPDDGYVVWRGGDRSRSRVPVVVAP